MFTVRSYEKSKKFALSYSRVFYVVLNPQCAFLQSMSACTLDTDSRFNLYSGTTDEEYPQAMAVCKHTPVIV